MSPAEWLVLTIKRYAQRLTQGYSAWGGSSSLAPGYLFFEDRCCQIEGEGKGDANSEGENGGESKIRTRVRGGVLKERQL